MTPLEERLRKLRAQKDHSFIPFVVSGHPDLKTTAALLHALAKLEPAAIEVGVPFSDPIADGTVIQRAAEWSLKKATTLKSTMEMIRTIRTRNVPPLILFTYYNPVLRLGLVNFARLAGQSGVAGVIVVDLPAEVAAPLQSELRRRGIDLIFLVAPTTSDERLRKIAQMATGLIYAIARTGVTGTARELRDESATLVRRIRSTIDLPVAVGFGIRTRAQAHRVWRYADTAVIGSYLVGAIEAAVSRPHWSRSAVIQKVLTAARAFV